MNIKLDLKNKIRLSQNDLQTLKKNQRYEQEFKITNIVHFLMTLTVEPGLRQSLFCSADQDQTGVKLQSISLRICEEDINKLLNDERINIADFTIEVDRWSSEKRNKVESAIINK